MDDYTWMNRAACKGQTDLYFPESGTMDKARKICADCPVQFECEEYGRIGVNLPMGTNRGLWGGKTAQELLDSEPSRQRGSVPGRVCPECGGPVPARIDNRGKPRVFCKRLCYRRDWERKMRPTGMNT
jgi:hypothetical protein